MARLKFDSKDQVFRVNKYIIIVQHVNTGYLSGNSLL